MECVVRQHAWRLSGVDAQRHAFAAEGGYIGTRDQWVALPLGGVVEEGVAEEGVECFGPYEVLLSACGVAMPVAMVMPAVGGPPCEQCAHHVQVLTRADSSQHDHLDAAVLA